MNICYVYQSEYPWDVRVQKFAAAFAEAGHQTFIVSRNRSGLACRETLATGIHVRRLPKGITSFDRNILNFPAFFSPIWIQRIVSTASAENCRVILVRDLPLVLAAVTAGKLLRKPVLLDMAEDYPAMIESTWMFRGPKPLDYVVRNPVFLRKLEKISVARVHGILTVSESSQARVRRLLDRSDIPMWVVGNTPSLSSGSPVSSTLAERMHAHHGLKLVYVGGLESMRGLETVIRSLPLLRELVPSVMVFVVGSGESQPRLARLARDLAVDGHVHWAGWVDQKFIDGIIAAADVGLIPHYVTAHTNTTIPNKIFDYMAQSKPVVVTQAQSLVDIVCANRCGLVYEDRDPTALARQLARMNDPEFGLHLGRNGAAAVRARFNWALDQATLLSAVEAIVKREGHLG